MPEARAIYQEFLDHSSQAVWDEDYEALGAMMVYPHRIGTADRVVDVADTEDLRRCASAFRANLRTLGATAYHRVAQAARFLAKDRIEGRHMSYALRGATPVVTPWSAEMTLVRGDAGWLGAVIHTQARNADIRINAGPPRFYTDESARRQRPRPVAPDIRRDQ